MPGGLSIAVFQSQDSFFGVFFSQAVARWSEQEDSKRKDWERERTSQRQRRRCRRRRFPLRLLGRRRFPLRQLGRRCFPLPSVRVF